jgi:hypothetical protein
VEFEFGQLATQHVGVDSVRIGSQKGPAFDGAYLVHIMRRCSGFRLFQEMHL